MLQVFRYKKINHLKFMSFEHFKHQNDFGYIQYFGYNSWGTTSMFDIRDFDIQSLSQSNVSMVFGLAFTFYMHFVSVKWMRILPQIHVQYIYRIDLFSIPFITQTNCKNPYFGPSGGRGEESPHANTQHKIDKLLQMSHFAISSIKAFIIFYCNWNNAKKASGVCKRWNSQESKN